MANGLQMGSVLPMPGKPAACLVWRWMVRHNRRKEEVLSTTERSSRSRLPGPSGTVENWNIKPGGPWYLLQSAPSDWVKLHTSLGPGDGLKRVAVDTNEFTGAIAGRLHRLKSMQTLRGRGSCISHASERPSPSRQLGPGDRRQRFFLPKVLLADAFQLQIAQVSQQDKGPCFRVRRDRGTIAKMTYCPVTAAGSERRNGRTSGQVNCLQFLPRYTKVSLLAASSISSDNSTDFAQKHILERQLHQKFCLKRSKQSTEATKTIQGRADALCSLGGREAECGQTRMVLYGQQIGQRNGNLFGRKFCPISSQDETIRMIYRIRELGSYRRIEVQEGSAIHQNSFCRQSHRLRT